VEQAAVLLVPQGVRSPRVNRLLLLPLSRGVRRGSLLVSSTLGPALTTSSTSCSVKSAFANLHPASCTYSQMFTQCRLAKRNFLRDKALTVFKLAVLWITPVEDEQELCLQPALPSSVQIEGPHVPAHQPKSPPPRLASWISSS